MRFCVKCGEARPEDGEWCSFCLERYEHLPRPEPRWWQPTTIRHGLAGRAVWAAVALAVLWFPLATFNSIGAGTGWLLFVAAMMLAPLVVGAILWRQS